MSDPQAVLVDLLTRVVGRCRTWMEADEPQMDDARWRAGFARLAPLALHFEMQAPFAQMSEAGRLARPYPNTTIVLNHAGLPPAMDRSAWQAAMVGLAPCGGCGWRAGSGRRARSPCRRSGARGPT